MTVRNKFTAILLVVLIAGIIGMAQVASAETSATTKKPVQKAAVIVGPRGGVGFGRTFIGPFGGFHRFGAFFPNTFIGPRFNTFFPNTFGFNTFFPNTFIGPRFGGFFPNTWGWGGWHW